MKMLFLCLCVLFNCSAKDDGKKQPPPEPKYSTIPGPDGLEYHTGLVHPEDESMQGVGAPHVRFTDCGELPESFDLRTLGLVPEIRNQGSCGSCWSFSKTASLESALLGEGTNLDLSEQELVSNDKSQWGCNGGLLTGFKYQIDHGQGLEKDFPYTARDSSSKGIPVAAKGISYQYVGSSSHGPTEKELKCALYSYKTVPWITVGATGSWGSPPKSEKTAYTSCAKAQTNHAVGVVGWWKDSSGKTQFIMKNSWGKNWGDQGYMSLPLGCNSFGDEVAFIEVEKRVPPSPSPTPIPPSPTPVPPSPTPGPCVPPKTKMAAEIQVFSGVEVMLGIMPESGVSYTWTVDDKVVGSESMLHVTPEKDGLYKLSAKNSCAVSESQVRVRIVQSVKH